MAITFTPEQQSNLTKEENTIIRVLHAAASKPRRIIRLRSPTSSTPTREMILRSMTNEELRRIYLPLCGRPYARNSHIGRKGSHKGAINKHELVTKTLSLEARGFTPANPCTTEF